jgi:hypothetical protein
MTRKPNVAKCLAVLMPWLVSFPATFYGVLFAAQVYSCNERENTKANLLQVHRAARAEAAESLRVLKGLAEERGGRTGGNLDLLPDERRLTLERPAAGLATLVGMPSFLEHGDSGITHQLVALSTKLTWTSDSYTPRGGKGSTSKLYLPPEERVVERLTEAIGLLDQEIQRLEDEV